MSSCLAARAWRSLARYTASPVETYVPLYPVLIEPMVLSEFGIPPSGSAGGSVR